MQFPKNLLTGFILILIFSFSAQVQPETGFGSRGERSENAAFKQVIINTVFPVTLGTGTVALFENETVKTVGASLAVYGLVIGPSTGNFYANDYVRGGLGALNRFGACLLLKDATRESFGKISSTLHFQINGDPKYSHCFNGLKNAENTKYYFIYSII